MGKRGPQPGAATKAATAAKKAKAAPTAPKAQGTTTKRTPSGTFDPAAGKETYEPEEIVGQRLAKGVTQYQVKWVGWATKDNTWEPIEHLAGCEDMIAEFKEKERTRIAQLEMVAQENHRQKEEAASAAAAKAAEDAAEARVAARAAGTGTPADAATADAKEPKKNNSGGGSKRSSPFWTVFDETGCEPGKACCTLPKAEGSGEICGECISTVGGPSGMKTHCMYKHPNKYIELMPPSEKLDLKLDPQTKLMALPAKHRDAIHKAIARWLCKRKRPLILAEDKEFHEVWDIAMKGAYTPPDHKRVLSDVLLLSAEGKAKLYDVNTSLRANGLKPAMAGDIWSDRGVSLFGMCEYYMSDKWEIEELVLAASPFSQRHTGAAIDTVTRDACVAAGLTHDVFSSVFYPVSDNASNMKNGWASFGRGPCCVHTGQLSVHVFLNHTRIKPMRDKEHGIVAHFSHATGVDGLGAFHKCQRECNLPEHHPVKDNDTRWSSGHDQMEFFRVQQRAVQLYDVDHARKAGDVYRQHQMGLEDWRINLESVAVLQPIADWTQHMQGTKYPTLPLVLPTVYGLIDGMAPETPLTLDFQGQASYELEPDQMHDGVLKARTDMYNDWVARWITTLDPEVKRTLAIATLLHPCFKAYDFIDGFDLIDQSDKAWALRELRTEWSTVWKPRPKPVEGGAPGGSADPMPAASPAANALPTATTAAQVPAAPAAAPAPTKQRKVFLSSLLGARVKKEEAAPAVVVVVRDELYQYLEDTDVPNCDEDILKWWRAREAKWPALAKMVKQYFAAPASSAGVERVFSAAGKMHGDLQKSAKDSTLEHSLFAAFNTD